MFIMDKEKSSRLILIASMVIFGTVGLFRRLLPLPSGAIAMVRGIIGAGFLALMLVIGKGKIDFSSMKGQLGKLVFSGALIGLNWVALFEAFRFTSVSVATVCYYMAPIIVVALSPVLLKEKLTLRKTVCVLAALLGAALVSGIFTGQQQGERPLLGVLLGFLAAVMYATVVLTNKRIENVAAYDRTIVQLGTAGLVLIPYVLAAETVDWTVFQWNTVILLLIVCIIHTGIAYALYFGSLAGVSGQTAALYSYIDPIVAVLISALVLQEKMGFWAIVGAVLVLGAAVVSELPERSSVK